MGLVKEINDQEMAKQLDTYGKLPVTTMEECFDTILMIREYRRKLAEMEKQVKEELKTIMQDKKIKSFQFEGKTLVKLDVKKTNRYETDKIIEAMKSDDQETRDLAFKCLPKNPKFNKTPSLKLQEKLGIMIHYEDLSEDVHIQDLPIEIAEQYKNKDKEVENGKEENTEPLA